MSILVHVEQIINTR